MRWEPSAIRVSCASDRRARAAKEALTTRDSVEVEIGGFRRTLTRRELDAAIRPLIEGTGPSARRALKDAGARESSTASSWWAARLAFGRPRYVQGLFGLPPLADIDPDEVVALGAAVQADLLTPRSRSTTCCSSTSRPFRWGSRRWEGWSRGSSCATRPSDERDAGVHHVRRGQTGMDIHVVQGERELVSDPLAGGASLSGIPPLPAGLARIAVTFQWTLTESERHRQGSSSPSRRASP